MQKPFVVAINAISGGGKTTLAQLVAASLNKAVAFYFDEFDATNTYPDDYYEWLQRGADLEEFDCPGLQKEVLKTISDRQVDYIILDYPFGREHSRFKELIDLSVFIDTPLDVAMARRLIRDFIDNESETADHRLGLVRKDLKDYLCKARHVYLDTFKQRDTCDLIVDGWKEPEVICMEILKAIDAELNSSDADGVTD